jgi:hypothetical protein
MLYSKFYLKKEFKIPTILSLFIIALTTYFIGRLFLTTSIPSRAEKGEIKKIEFVNIFPSQASVVWITDKPGHWWLLYGESSKKLDKVAYDIRENSDIKIVGKNHFALLKDLKSSTRYYVKLTDGKKLIANSNNEPYAFETVEGLTSLNNINPAFGAVYNNNEQPVENALIILSVENSNKLASLSKKNGEWVIPLNYISNNLTKKQKIVSVNEKVDIEIYDDSGNKSNIKALISGLSPISKKITIGKNYNFVNEQQVLGENTSSFKIGNIDFIYPKQNSLISSFNPLIKGIGIAGNDIKIKITGKNLYKVYNLKIKNDNTWSISSPLTLQSGKYSLSLETKDKNNKNIIKTRNFEIAKSGERVLGEATPSSVIETPQLQPTIEASTPQPTTEVSTPEPTIEFTPIPTLLPTETPIPTIPVTGSTIIPLSIVSATLIIIGVAFLAL